MSHPTVATATMMIDGEKIEVPEPQLDIHSGADPPGRGRITRLMPESAR